MVTVPAMWDVNSRYLDIVPGTGKAARKEIRFIKPLTNSSLPNPYSIIFKRHRTYFRQAVSAKLATCKLLSAAIESDRSD